MDEENSGLSSLQNGDVAELKIQTRLVQLGYTVCTPIGDNDRYDLVVDIGGELHRVQCKSGFFPDSEADGAMRVELRSRSYRTQGRVKSETYDEDELDAYAIFNPEADEVYWIEFEDAPKTQLNINTTDPAEASPAVRAKSRFAQDVLIEDGLPFQ